MLTKCYHLSSHWFLIHLDQEIIHHVIRTINSIETLCNCFSLVWSGQARPSTQAMAGSSTGHTTLSQTP